MINKQLIDYIKNEAQRGVTQENTKSALLGIGWKDADVKEAYASLSGAPAKSKFNKKFIYIPVILLLLVGGGVFAFLKFTSTPNLNTDTITTETNTIDTNLPVEPIINESPIQAEQPALPTQVTPPITVTISEVDRVTAIMTEICQGYITGDNSLIIKHASLQTIPLISKNKLNATGSCVASKIYEENTNIIAEVNTTSTMPEKPSIEPGTTQNMVFIKEEGIWKYDLAASEKFTKDQNKTKLLSGDLNGFVDLVITGITTSPARAIINKKDLKVTITIKNTGTKTSENGASLSASLIGFKDETPTIGGTYEPILPGATTEWAWYPYKYNTLLGISDIAGEKTIQIEVNKDRKITESNYENNIFTKVLQTYAK